MSDPRVTLKQIKKDWKSCNDCGLGEHTHNHVFFRGTTPCDVLFIGEAPGRDEDLVGQPFVGRSGDVLNALIQSSYQELQDQGIDEPAYVWGITNVLACRPVGLSGKDRPPTPSEAKACSLRLEQTILACRPKVIILLGRSAEKHYKMPEGLAPIPAIWLEHPAFILRNGGIGSSKFDSVLVRLSHALRKHLYGQETPLPKKAIYGPKTSRPKR